MSRSADTPARKTPYDPPTDSAKARHEDLANWRRLGQGMSMDEVRKWLGEPLRVKKTEYFTYGYDHRKPYQFDGRVRFSWVTLGWFRKREKL